MYNQLDAKRSKTNTKYLTDTIWLIMAKGNADGSARDIMFAYITSLVNKVCRYKIEG